MKHNWDVYHNIFGRPVLTIQAATKAEAEECAFKWYGNPMLVDLNRREV